MRRASDVSNSYWLSLLEIPYLLFRDKHRTVSVIFVRAVQCLVEWVMLFVFARALRFLWISLRPSDRVECGWIGAGTARTLSTRPTGRDSARWARSLFHSFIAGYSAVRTSAVLDEILISGKPASGSTAGYFKSRKIPCSRFLWHCYACG
jgi:hypothetical protein